MPDFPVAVNVDPLVLSPACPQSIGCYINAIGSALSSLAWSSANKAFYIPIAIGAPITILKMFVINGATVSGNIDVGIYDVGGARLVSSGSVAQSGVSVIQEFDITDTLLQAGLYYLACARDNTTGTLEGWSPTGSIMRAIGVCEQASAFPLPATATFALLSGTVRTPFIGASQRGLL